MYPDGVPADEPAPDRKSERQRRTMIGTVGVVGALLLFRLTGPLDRAVDWPTPMVYALSGAIAGGVFGALSRAKNRALYALQIGAAAVIGGAVFVFLLSRAAVGPPFYWWQN